MTSAKSRLSAFYNVITDATIRQICESILDVADNIPDPNLSNILLEKFKAYSNNGYVKEFLLTEKRFNLLYDMGIKEASDKILESSIVRNYPHIKGNLVHYRDMSSKVPDYSIADGFISVLKQLEWDSLIKEQLNIISKKYNSVSEDILIKQTMDYIVRSKNNYIYSSILEKLDTYLISKNASMRKLLINELDKYRFDVTLNKLANNLKVLENINGSFNIINNSKTCKIEPTIGLAYITESEDYFGINNNFFKKTKNSIKQINRNEMNKVSSVLLKLSDILNASNVQLVSEGVTFYVPGKNIKIDENRNIYLNGNKVSKGQLQHEVSMSTLINPMLHGILSDVLYVYENFDYIMELDFSKTIKSSIYEGLSAYIIKGDKVLVNTNNNSTKENKIFEFTSGNKLRNFILENLSFDISESFTDLLEGENKVLVELNNQVRDVLDQIKEYENQLHKISQAKVQNSNIRNSEKIKDLETSLNEELDFLKGKYRKLNQKIDIIKTGSNAAYAFKVGDIVEVVGYGSGVINSIDEADNKYHVFLNTGKQIPVYYSQIRLMDNTVSTKSDVTGTITVQSDILPIKEGINSILESNIFDTEGPSMDNPEDVDDEEDIISIDKDDIGLNSNPSMVIKHPDHGDTLEKDLDNFDSSLQAGEEFAVNHFNDQNDEEYIDDEDEEDIPNFEEDEEESHEFIDDYSDDEEYLEDDDIVENWGWLLEEDVILPPDNGYDDDEDEDEYTLPHYKGDGSEPREATEDDEDEMYVDSFEEDEEDGEESDFDKDFNLNNTENSLESNPDNINIEANNDVVTDTENTEQNYDDVDLSFLNDESENDDQVESTKLENTDEEDTQEDTQQDTEDTTQEKDASVSEKRKFKFRK